MATTIFPVQQIEFPTNSLSDFSSNFIVLDHKFNLLNYQELPLNVHLLKTNIIIVRNINKVYYLGGGGGGKNVHGIPNPIFIKFILNTT